jgi:hypothetical protein
MSDFAFSSSKRKPARITARKEERFHGRTSSPSESASLATSPLSPALEKASDMAFDEPNEGYES